MPAKHSQISSKSQHCDLAILGGGLAGGLIAMAMAKLRPEISLLLIEQEETFGGNHIWSFFSSDIAAEHRWLIAPLIAHGWRHYDVKFPERERTIDALYYAITSEQFDKVLRKTLDADQYVNGISVDSHGPSHVLLSDGHRIEARGVIDARGPGDLTHLHCGWQKFCGQMLDCSEPHGLERPIIMDATVDQHDSYRFVYCLPFSPTQIFVEDTYYSDTPDLDSHILAQRIAQYTDAKGWQVERITREETGILPVTMGGDIAAYLQSTGGRNAKAGARAGLFHGLTSYSLPDAVRYAVYIAEQRALSGHSLAETSRQYVMQHWQKGRFYRMLSRMLFHGGAADQRYRILQHFYRLPENVIARFYAGQSTLYDAARTLVGKPPIPITGAIRALLSSSKPHT